MTFHFRLILVFITLATAAAAGEFPPAKPQEGNKAMAAADRLIERVGGLAIWASVWETSIDGSWRFEDVEIRTSTKPFTIPSPPESSKAEKRSSGGINKDSRWPESLVGVWHSTTTHLFADGTRMAERGEIKCSWILNKTHVQCERRYVASNGRKRQSIQFYTRDIQSGCLDVLTIYAGRSIRIFQTGTKASERTVSLTGMIPLQDNQRQATRTQIQLVTNNRIEIHNETEEAPGYWRRDYEEIYVRRK